LNRRVLVVELSQTQCARVRRFIKASTRRAATRRRMAAKPHGRESCPQQSRGSRRFATVSPRIHPQILRKRQKNSRNRFSPDRRMTGATCLGRAGWQCLAESGVTRSSTRPLVESMKEAEVVSSIDHVFEVGAGGFRRGCFCGRSSCLGRCAGGLFGEITKTLPALWFGRRPMNDSGEFRRNALKTRLSKPRLRHQNSAD